METGLINIVNLRDATCIIAFLLIYKLKYVLIAYQVCLNSK